MSQILDLTEALGTQEAEEGQNAKAGLNDLPNELLINILKYLPYNDLQQIRLVCKRLLYLRQLPEFWSKSKLVIQRDNIFDIYKLTLSDGGNKLLQTLPYDSLELRRLEIYPELLSILHFLREGIYNLILNRTKLQIIGTDFFPELQELILSHIDPVPSDDIFDLSVNKFKYLKAVEVSCPNIPTHVKGIIILNLRYSSYKMEKLSIELNSDHESVLRDVLQLYSNSLKHLEIHVCSFPSMLSKWAKVFSFFKQLKYLKIYGLYCSELLNVIFDYLPEETPLQHCDLSGVLNMDDALLKLIISKWPRTLEHMELMFCSALTDESIRDLKLLHHNLKTLNVAHCGKISLSGLIEGLTSDINNTLKTLVLNNMVGIHMKSVNLLIQRLPQLTHLNLENCYDSVTDYTLQCIIRSMPKLQHLILNGCIRITDEGLLGFGIDPAPISKLKGLLSLELRSCSNLSNRALSDGLQFNELRKLVLGYSHKITSAGIEELVKNCPALEDLTITSCRLIDRDGMVCIANGLHRLRRLNISNCLDITEIPDDYFSELFKHVKELCWCDKDLSQIEEEEENSQQLN